MATSSDVWPIVENSIIQNLSQETQARMEALYKRGRCITILVIGRYRVGKSTLINAMFGRDVAEVGHGANSSTTEVHNYVGNFKGVTINIYDTPGFRDTKGRREHDILIDIAKRGQFDLILICTKLEDKDNQYCNFPALASYFHADMWKRTVVVLTFANHFITLESVKKQPDLEEEIKKTIDSHKDHLMTSLSKSISKEVLEGIPFCLAGVKDGRKLPTADDWLKELWCMCVDHSSEEVREFLTFYARYHHGIIETGSFLGSVGAGAGIGAAVGSVVPGPGTAIGAAVGAGVGGVVSLVGIGLGRIFR
uniref:AIG1-type G domain-containing protein n=1 Tax=Amphimedon queenslandica TaxID=400682 RepID=A0A1X7TNF6_AMPQE